MFWLLVSEWGQNVDRAVLWYYLVRGYYRGAWQLFVLLPGASFYSEFLLGYALILFYLYTNWCSWQLYCCVSFV
jgi:hypothetical protein